MSDIHMIIYDQRAYAGILGTEEDGTRVLDDGVEFHVLADPKNGALGFNAVKVGKILPPEDVMMIELSNDSPYSQAYRSVVSNLKLM